MLTAEIKKLKETNKKLESNISGEVEKRVTEIVKEKDKALKHTETLNEQLRKNENAKTRRAKAAPA